MTSFTLGACQVRLGFSCFALLAFCCLFLGAGSSAFFLAAALLHELAHVAILFVLRAPPALVQLTALGCRMVPNRERTLSYGQAALVSWAGPGVNLLCAGGMLAAGETAHPFFFASLGLGLLHSLPIEPLDGGLALRSLLSLRLGPRRAGRFATGVSLLFLFPMAVLGFLILLRTRYIFTLLAMSLYLMLYLLLGKDLSL